MAANFTRRGVVALGSAALAAPFLSRVAFAQEQVHIRFSAVFSEQDIRAQMMKKFVEGIGAGFKYEGFYGGVLFKQGTELVALQRGNLEMSNIAPQDVSNQVPAWSLLTSGYLFRDSAHMTKFFASDAGAEMKAMAEDQLGIKILGPTFYGTRQVGLNTTGKVNTPADLAGVKLRMPGGEAWQFLGTALGANPTPMAYAEVYTGLQTGAIDYPIPDFPASSTGEIDLVMDYTFGLTFGLDPINIPGTGGQQREPDTLNLKFVVQDKEGNKSDTAIANVIVIR